MEKVSATILLTKETHIALKIKAAETDGENLSSLAERYIKEGMERDKENEDNKSIREIKE